MSEDTQSGDKPHRQGFAPKPPEQKPSGAELKTPREWALATGNGPKPQGRNQWSGPGFSRPMGSVEHEVAAVLHGWREHEHETGEAPKMSKDDYLAALKASHPEDEYELEQDGKTPKRDRDGNPVIKKHGGSPVPHSGALSPYKGKLGSLRLGEKPQAVKS